MPNTTSLEDLLKMTLYELGFRESDHVSPLFSIAERPENENTQDELTTVTVGDVLAGWESNYEEYQKLEDTFSRVLYRSKMCELLRKLIERGFSPEQVPLHERILQTGTMCEMARKRC